MADRQAWDLAFDPATGRRLPRRRSSRAMLPVQPLAELLLPGRGRLQWDAQPSTSPRTPGVARAPRGASRAAHEAPRRLPRGRGRRRRAPRRRSAPRPTTRWWPGSCSCSAATSSATRVLRPRRRRGARAARGHRGRAARRGAASSPRPAISSSSRSGCPRWRPRWRGPRRPDDGIGLYHMVLEGIVLPPGSARCSTTWRTARCRGCARAWSASSSTSAGTSASACAA